MTRVSALRFFRVVSPLPHFLRLAFMAAVGIGAWTLWLDPREIDSALGPVLLLQMCAVSNGYAFAASRGWFDPLLVTEGRRRRIAWANLAASAYPGVAAWAVVALIEMLIAGGRAPAALAAQRTAAFALVTSGAWTLGLRLPRMGAAMLWIAGLAALASTRALLPEMASLQSPPRVSLEYFSDVLACVLCPFLLLGNAAAIRDPLVISGVLGVAAISALAGVSSIARRAVPLESAA